MGWGKKGKGWTLDLCAINYRTLVFKFEMCNFLFGTQTLIYQKTTKGVLGGGLGWRPLLKSQYYFWNLFHIMYDISVSYFWFFRNKFMEYYKLYFCRSPSLCSLGKKIRKVKKSANDPSRSFHPMFHISLDSVAVSVFVLFLLAFTWAWQILTIRNKNQNNSDSKTSWLF